MLKNNTKNNYKAFVRATSNIHSTTNAYQVNLPPIVFKKLKWKINESIRIVIDKENKSLNLTKEE